MPVSEDEYDALWDGFDDADLATVVDAVSHSAQVQRAVVPSAPYASTNGASHVTGGQSSSASSGNGSSSRITTSFDSRPAATASARSLVSVVPAGSALASTSNATLPVSSVSSASAGPSQRAQTLARVISEAARTASPLESSTAQTHYVPHDPARSPPKRPLPSPDEILSTLLPKRARVEARPSSSNPHSSVVLKALAEYEEELTCPICCDLLAGAYIGNCGHTLCSGCGWQWVDQNKRAPTCPICRAKLTRKAPLMPNITLDAVLARHVAALRAAGADGWAAPDLSRHVEWTARCTKARTAAAERAVAAAAKARAAPPARARPRVVVFEPNGGPWLVPDDDDEDETYEASDGEPSAGAVFVHQVGRRASRRR